MKKLILLSLIMLFASCEKKDTMYLLTVKITYTSYYDSDFFFVPFSYKYEIKNIYNREKAIKIRAQNRKEEVVNIFIKGEQTKAIRKSECEINIIEI